MIFIFKHISIEGPGTIAEFFDQRRIDYKIVELSEGGRFPKDLNGIGGLIMLGGPMNVYEEEEHSFLKEENAFIQLALKENIPLLGICLGSQLLAKACGAQVRKSPQKEHGFSLVDQTQSGNTDPLFDGLGEQLIAFQWHEDTFDIPEDGILLTTSEIVKHQALRAGPNAYGFQYHIEVDKAIIESWIKKYFNVKNAEDSDAGRKMLEQYDQLEPQFRAQAQQIYENFDNIISTYRKEKAVA